GAETKPIWKVALRQLDDQLRLARTQLHHAPAERLAPEQVALGVERDAVREHRPELEQQLSAALLQIPDEQSPGVVIACRIARAARIGEVQPAVRAEAQIVWTLERIPGDLARQHLDAAVERHAQQTCGDARSAEQAAVLGHVQRAVGTQGRAVRTAAGL